MAELFSTLGTWNWLVFGLLLMGLELLAPGVFLFWLGLAAGTPLMASVAYRAAHVRTSSTYHQAWL